MHSSPILAVTAALALLAPALASAAAGQPAVAPLVAAQDLVSPPLRSRHASRAPREDPPAVRRSSASVQHKLRSRCKASTSGQKVLIPATGSTIEDQQNNSTSEASSGLGNGVDWDVGSSFLKVGNIFVGFLPDDGSGGGKPESMKQINSMLPAKSAWYGRYAQVTNGKTFDGSQLYSVLDDVKESGAILAASVMPYGTWYGLTESDNRNAVAIAKVCNDIYKNHGIEVFLRFAHEMNWYQVDGTYSGGVQDFQTGWKVLSKAIEEHAPETKLWWSPNVGSDADYERYYPKEGRVDVVGFDWYPNNPSDSFVERAKPFHDRYAKGNIKMIQGETGLHYTGSNEEKMQWVRSLSSSEAQSQMPNYLGWMHFNYDKFENGRQVDFKIVKPEEGRSSGINSQFLSFIAQ